LSGFGIGVFSKDGLNAAIWGKQDPSALENHICAGSLDITTDVWGLSIVNHERNAWSRYLDSRKTDFYKRRWLDNVIEGQLPAKGDPNYQKRLRRMDKELRGKGERAFELADRATTPRTWGLHQGGGIEIENVLDMLREYNPETDFVGNMSEITTRYKPSDFQSGIKVNTFENERWNKLATGLLSESQESGKWVPLYRPHIGVEYRDMIEAGYLKLFDGGYMLTPLAFELLSPRFARHEPKVHLDKEDIERLADLGVIE
jgi:hypothetical protein